VLEPKPLIPSVPALKNARLLHKLAGGPTSDSWLLSLADSKVVLRIDKPLARILCLDRVAELGVLAQVAHAGFGPDIIWADPANGMLATEYICGSHWTISDASRPENIERLAVRVRELHSTSINGPVLEMAEAAGRYASVAGTAQASELHAQVIELLQLLGNESTGLSFCHNDLGYQNIVDTGEIKFIDWEYAASGHSFFDLAGIVRQNGFSQAQARQLQRAYFGVYAPKFSRRLQLYSRLYGLVSTLWRQAVCAANTANARCSISRDS
jgi:thiamine kinase-like enzyme